MVLRMRTSVVLDEQEVSTGRDPACDPDPEQMRVAEIVERYARTPLDAFKPWPDKAHFISSNGQCVIAYRVAHRMAITLGDPVGPESEIERAIGEFLHFSRMKQWKPAFYQTLPDFLPLYQRFQLKKLKVGDDAIVELDRFCLEGKSKRDQRSKLHQFEEAGVRLVEYRPPVPDGILAQLKIVSDQWLEIPGRRERSFTVGHFDPDYLRSRPVLTVIDPSGIVLAFINLIAVDRREITGDLMRRRTDAPNGVMDYLFVKLCEYAQEKGFTRVSLGMAPMTGFRPDEQVAVEERLIHGLFRKLDFLFSFQGLYRYKSKFATTWEPRYLIYTNFLQLPRAALALQSISEIKEDGG